MPNIASYGELVLKKSDVEADIIELMIITAEASDVRICVSLKKCHLQILAQTLVMNLRWAKSFAHPLTLI